MSATNSITVTQKKFIKKFILVLAGAFIGSFGGTIALFLLIKGLPLADDEIIKRIENSKHPMCAYGYLTKLPPSFYISSYDVDYTIAHCKRVYEPIPFN